MIPELTLLGIFRVKTFSLLLTLAVVLSLVFLYLRAKRESDRPLSWVDAGIAGLAGGVLFGRLVHVALNWEYFSSHTQRVLRFSRGGYDWHGALIGVIIATLLFAHFSGLKATGVFKAYAFILPVFALFSYSACLLSGCFYGSEVATLAGYPPFVVMELPDIFGLVAPRYASQVFGMVGALLLLIGLLLLAKTRWVKQGGFWLGMVFLSLLSFGLAFFLGGDTMMFGTLRGDQLLDLLMAVVGIIGLASSLIRPPAHEAFTDEVRTYQKEVE